MSAPDLVLRAMGVATSVVGPGRPGRARLGAPRGGAVDAASHALGARLLGNDPGTACLETSGGATIVLGRTATLALTGAIAHVGVVGGPPLGWGTPTVLPAGAEVHVGRVVDGARVYLSVRGGLVPHPDGMTIGPEPAALLPGVSAPRTPLTGEVRLWPGPRLDWFDAEAWGVLTTAGFRVTETSRVGVRLAGPLLVRAVHDELPSEGMVEGAVQVPPDGQPIVMLADHPVTGGYPVIGVVEQADLVELAQASIGSVIRFRTTRR